jgi:hypothetical protein
MPDNICWDELIAIDEFYSILSNSRGSDRKWWIFQNLCPTGAMNRKQHRKRQGMNLPLTCHTNITQEITEHRDKLSLVVKTSICHFKPECRWQSVKW